MPGAEQALKSVVATGVSIQRRILKTKPKNYSKYIFKTGRKAQRERAHTQVGAWAGPWGMVQRVRSGVRLTGPQGAVAHAPAAVATPAFLSPSRSRSCGAVDWRMDFENLFSKPPNPALGRKLPTDSDATDSDDR